jgi:MFS family permease
VTDSHAQEPDDAEASRETGTRQPAHGNWRPFLAVEAGTALSGIGNGVTTVALPWLILERTGSATAAGLLAAITAVPTMIAALLSGTIVDRVGRRRVSVISDVLSLVSVALIPILDNRIGLDFTIIAVLAVFGAVFDPAGMGARESMVPEAAESAHLTLSKANGIHEAVWGGAFVIGPAVGGVLIGFFGASSTFWVTAAMFAASAIVIAAVKIPGGDPPQHRDEAGFVTATRHGIEFVWADRLLRTLAILMMALVGIWLPVEGVLLPVFYEAQGSPGNLGIVLMALALGGIAGALAFGPLASRFKMHSIFITCLIVTGVGVLAMSTLPTVVVLAGIAVATGLAFGPIQPIMNVAMQTRTPSRLRGRVVGMLTAIQYAAGPFGFLLAGPLVDAVGVEWAFPIMAGLLLLVCFSALAMRPLRELNTLDAHAPPPLEETQPPRPMS